MKTSEPQGFLADMVRSSARRVAALSGLEGSLERRAARRSKALAPRYFEFDIIAEIKLHSPSQGVFASAKPAELSARVRTYASAGAAAISVLTEPTRFGGSLEHLAIAADTAHSFSVPVLCKDFIVDPVQLVEARAHGADGVLLIARIVSDRRLQMLLERARALGLFVLLEAFDRTDLVRIRRSLKQPADSLPHLLVGVNARNLDTLDIDPERQAQLVGELPTKSLRVAESGVQNPSDAARARCAGYDLALVGTALMRAPDPGELLSEMLAAGRDVTGSQATNSAAAVDRQKKERS